MTRRTGRARHEGQASLEFLATVPAMVLGAMIALQLAITGYALHLGGRGGRGGRPCSRRRNGPGGRRRRRAPRLGVGRMDVVVDGGRIEVAVRPPAPLPEISDALEVTAEAWARSADGG